MQDKVRKYVEKWCMLDAEDKVIVGVSGGADSVCLLLLLMELKKEIGFELVAVHVHHGIRGAEADADEAYVRKICEELGVFLYTYHEDVVSVAKKRKQSIEEAGRNTRRACFEKAMRDFGGTKTALAHHKDDNVETLILNLARGSALRGLGGMRPVNGVFIRPLLCLRRVEIEEYLKEKSFGYCVDASNDEDDYTRNRIRHNIVPAVEAEVNMQFVEHAHEAMEGLRLLQDYVEEEALKWKAVCGREPHLIEEVPFQQVPEALKGYVIRAFLAEEAGQAKDIGAVHIRDVQSLFFRQSGKQIDLPYGLRAVRCYEGVRFEKKETDKEEKMLPEITCRVFDNKEGLNIPEKANTKWIDYDIIKGDIMVRTREAGDYIAIDETGKTQKLKSYFINEKVPKEERNQIPLVADGNHIIWIVGHRISAAYKVTGNTRRILEIQIEGEETWQKK